MIFFLAAFFRLGTFGGQLYLLKEENGYGLHPHSTVGKHLQGRESVSYYGHR